MWAKLRLFIVVVNYKNKLQNLIYLENIYFVIRMT